MQIKPIDIEKYIAWVPEKLVGIVLITFLTIWFFTKVWNPIKAFRSAIEAFNASAPLQAQINEIKAQCDADKRELYKERAENRIEITKLNAIIDTILDVAHEAQMESGEGVSKTFLVRMIDRVTEARNN